jgi:RNA polymerase sigma factor (sigma-70 family)
METLDFDRFLADLRAGDEQAAAELVRRYEPYLRQVIRVRLTDPCLRRVFDSLDVCQSVLGDFFVRMADGCFQFQDADRMRALLVTMALNRLIDRARRERRHGGGLPEDFDPLGPAPTPAERTVQCDLVEAIRARLSDRESWVLDQRLQGRTWTEIAALDGGQPDALRMLYARAVARVRREFPEELSDVP